MDSPARTDPETQSTARLLIHSGSGVKFRGAHIDSPLRWLRTLYSAAPSLVACVPLILQIEDLQGRQVFAFDDGGPLTVLALPPGTYHVNARRGNVRRRYTMTLTRGASFDLYLNLSPIVQ